MPARVIVVLRACTAGATGSSRSRSTLTDPLGLERVEQRFEEPSDVLMRPRVPVLASVFSSHGAREAGAARSRVPAADRVRDPRRPRVRARRAAAGGPLAEHRPARAPDGEGARRRAARRPRGRARPTRTVSPGRPAGRASMPPSGRPGRSRSPTCSGTAASPSSARRLRRRRRAGPHSGHDWEVALDALAAVGPVAGARRSSGRCARRPRR